MLEENSSYQNKIINHYVSIWKLEPNTYLWDKGQFEKLPYNFRVLEFSPNNSRNFWTYSTACMSQSTDKDSIELHIFSHNQDESLIELLTSIVFYHRNTAPVGLNHTVNFGRPWKNGSLCEFGLISLPYLDGPQLEKLELKESGKAIQFYWIIPITEEERNFKKRFGITALEEKFDNGLNYIDPKRKSIV